MPVVAIASFNIRWGVDRRGRRWDVAGALRALDADVLVVQEAFVPRGPARGSGLVDEAASLLGYEIRHLPLAGGLQGRRPRAVRFGRRSHGNWGVALLTRLPVVDGRAADFGQLPRDRARRGALILTVLVRDVPLVVAGTHMSHLSYGSPLQMRRLARTLATMKHPAVVAGDLNMWGPLVDVFLPGWQRAVRGRTYPASRPHSQIDHILVTPDVRVRSSGVVRVGRSDHLPVRAELEVCRAAGGSVSRAEAEFGRP